MAELLGQEAALFLPTATMANQIALRVLARRGGELLAEERTHVLVYEAGGAGRQLRARDARARRRRTGCSTPEQVEAAVAAADPPLQPAELLVRREHAPQLGRPGLAARRPRRRRVTRPRARPRGPSRRRAPLQRRPSRAACRPPSTAASPTPSRVCFSKGLGCPLGAVLAGRAELIERAWVEKFRFGGAMRQAGIVAAAGAPRARPPRRAARRRPRAGTAAVRSASATEGSPSSPRRRTSSRSRSKGRDEAETLRRLEERGRPPVGPPSRLAARGHVPRRRRRGRGRRLGADPSRPRGPCPSVTASSARSSAARRPSSGCRASSPRSVRGGEVVWSEAVGLADLEAERPATPETQYRIGSITKTFTAAAVFQLRDEGLLDLDDPVGKHVEELSVRTPTIRARSSRTRPASSASSRGTCGRRW